MITSKECEILKEYKKQGYKWIARDFIESLFVYDRQPIRVGDVWETKCGDSLYITHSEKTDTFQDVSWQDGTPTKIDDLIREYESHQIVVGDSNKVLIPQFIADWIEQNKGVYTLQGLFANSDMPEKVQEWLRCDSHNCNVVAKAWLDGYEINKKKLYTVELANGQTVCKDGEHISLISDPTKISVSQLTKEEYELLKVYRAKGYGWIARSKNGNLCAFKVMPVKSTPFWTVERGFHLPCLVGERGDNILTCVTWKDEEPTKINALINDYESHLVLTSDTTVPVNSTIATLEKVEISPCVVEWVKDPYYDDF